MLDLRLTEDEVSLILGALTHEADRLEESYKYTRAEAMLDLFGKIVTEKTR